MWYKRLTRPHSLVQLTPFSFFCLQKFLEKSQQENYLISHCREYSQVLKGIFRRGSQTTVISEISCLHHTSLDGIFILFSVGWVGCTASKCNQQISKSTWTGIVLLLERVTLMILFPRKVDHVNLAAGGVNVSCLIRNSISLHQASDCTDRLCVLWTWTCWHSLKVRFFCYFHIQSFVHSPTLIV